MKRAVVFNLGCKVNRYECDVIAAGLAERGYEVFDELVTAELYVINTCAVTAEAERKSRQILSRIYKLNPSARIMITGCAGQKNGEFYKKKGVNYVSGVSGKGRIFDSLDKDVISDLPAIVGYEEPQFTPKVSRTRAFVKIQDGCDNFCTYCVIPYLRGRSRSRAVDLAASEIYALSDKTDEIVITGINLSKYGEDNGESLSQLIRRLSPLDTRIRLGSFYVEGINKELLDALFSLKRFCPQFHLSLQYGEDSVLKSMNRHYSVADYSRKVEEIRSYDHGAAITTDIIVGFPTETDETFLKTVDFVKSTRFSDIHIFPFSAREGTAAYSMQRLPKELIDERKGTLHDVKQKLHNEYLKSKLGEKLEVLFEGESGEGYSREYVRVYNKNGNGIMNVSADEIYREGIKGEIIK